MVTFAVAGTGNVCKQIIKAYLAESNPKHTPIVLSRTPKPDLAVQGITVRVVDYGRPESLRNALAGVHTVISTISPDFDSLETPDLSPSFVNALQGSQLALLDAAKAVGAKRFVPSAWDVSEEGCKTADAYGPKIVVWEAVKKSGLEYTAIRPGIFMNYLAAGSPRPGVLEDCFDGLRSMPFIVDVENCTADIPGDGETRVCFTTTQDTGRFALAALDIPDGQWTEESGCSGWVGSLNELVQEAERIRGKKFQVTYTSLEKLKEREAKETRFMLKFFLQVMMMVAKGEACPRSFALNMSGVKATTLTEFLQKWWGQQ